MILSTLILNTLAFAVAHLLDILTLLLLIRAISLRWTVPLLKEFDAAGRPLVDGTLRTVTRLWLRIVPHRNLSGLGAVLMAWLLITILRTCLTASIRIVTVAA